MYETGARVSEILSLKRKHIEEAPQGYYRILIEEPKNGDILTQNNILLFEKHTISL